jgi:hypothetical protein
MIQTVNQRTTEQLMNTRTPQIQRAAESGNVLFLILIAVALFAALSYAVTQSSRSGGGDANTEKNLISSAQLTQYPAGIRTSIVRMLINGVDVNDLLFNTPADFGDGNPIDDVSTAPADVKMVHDAVFHPSGGGATYSPAPPDLMADGAQADWVFSSKYEVTNIGTSVDTSSDGNDIIAFLPGVSISVCKKIVSQLGISTTGFDTDKDGVPSAGAAGAATAAPVAADGMYEDSGGTHTGIPATEITIAGGLSGQPYGCFDADDNDKDSEVVYYHVLVER